MRLHGWFLLVCVLVVNKVSVKTDYYDKSFCQGRPIGNYADNEDCRAFYQCFHDITTHVSNLATGVMYDPKLGVIRFASDVDCPIRKVLREVWLNVPGGSISSLTSLGRYPCLPNVTTLHDTFCIYSLLNEKNDFYGQRLRGYLKAPISGPYVFETSCDDRCQVWLGEAEEKRRIIINQNIVGQRGKWNVTTDQISKPVHLKKDQVYYLEVLHKEATRTSFMCLGMLIPGQSLSERPISSRHLVISDDQILNLKCKTQVSAQEQLKKLKIKTEELKKKLPQATDSQKQAITQEFSSMLDRMLQDENAGQWDPNNGSDAMSISVVTEDYGKALAESLHNDSSPVTVTSSTMVLQASVIHSELYKFPNRGSMPLGQQLGDNDQIEVKMPERKDAKVFSVLYMNLNKFLSISSSRPGPASRIISTLMTSPAPADIQVSLHFKIEQTNHSSSVPRCSWWDSNSSNVKWSSEGCSVTSYNTTHTTCTCNHLTSFAVLMQVDQGEGSKMSAVHQQALSIITYVGCALSLLGITLSVIIFTCVTGLRSKRNMIHLNLAINVGIVQVIFLAGIEATSNLVVCRIVAAFLHYFCLTSFAWMLVEGVFLYIMVVNVFESHKDHMKVYLGCSYGIPAVIVIISASIAYEGYGTNSICWLSIDGGVIYAFVGPALTCILVNTIILILVIKEIIQVQKKSATGDKSNISMIRSGVKSAFVLLPLLGLTWLFGVLALGEGAIIMQYLFALSNSLQGFFIFILHCALNSEVRRALARMREVWFSRHGNLLASTSSTPSRQKSGLSTTDKTANYLTKETDLASRTSDRKSSYNQLNADNRKLNDSGNEAMIMRMHDHYPRDSSDEFKQPITRQLECKPEVKTAHLPSSLGRTDTEGWVKDAGYHRNSGGKGSLPGVGKRSISPIAPAPGRLPPLKNAPSAQLSRRPLSAKSKSKKIKAIVQPSTGVANT
ncbi:adhesion G-protein coupled receptor D1 isoform X2 [Nematostella vectensis]|uniref:adhesion G-protein coupled receptor D1 isoform X2 n=1 Tax=Nematostella vectensis TaxID=45351 RepID=UPI002076DB1A|nr:adhesion G-protein coupled receptor D1 isoform X2 [Nematostella vectensis]